MSEDSARGLASYSKGDSWTTRYDPLIEQAALRWLGMLPGVPWLQWKAQLAAESGLDASVRSGAGAMGIAQIMPRTWDRMRAVLHWPRDATPYEAYYGIEGGAWLMGQLWDAWHSPRPEAARLDLARASYNAGLGNILKAQKIANGALLSADILAELAQVTGAEHAAETLGYVARCREYYEALRKSC